MIYVIEDGRGHVKIGVTGRLAKRLTNLQTGDADPHRLRCAVVVGSTAVERTLEAVFRRAFRADAAAGGHEWFRDSPAIRAWCAALKAGRRSICP